MTTNTDSRSRIETVTLLDGDMRASVLNFGAITQGWWYKGVPLILGYDEPDAYFSDPNYLGAIVGRVANRIGAARFRMEGSSFKLNANEGSNTLHGGQHGLSHQFWDIAQPAANEAILTYVSQDGESGFPGEVRFEVRISLEFPRLVYSVFAQPDRPTPISITQHNYYTLGASDGVIAYNLKLASNRYLDVDHQGIASGRLHATNEEELDFTTPKAIGTVSGDVDHYFCFDHDRVPDEPVAELRAPSGLALTVYSDQPGAQVYSGAKLTKPFRGSAGLCIEPSGYPNALNISSFPSIIYSPDNPYRQVMTLQVSENRYES